MPAAISALFEVIESRSFDAMVTIASSAVNMRRFIGQQAAFVELICYYADASSSAIVKRRVRDLLRTSSPPRSPHDVAVFAYLQFLEVIGEPFTIDVAPSSLVNRGFWWTSKFEGHLPAVARPRPSARDVKIFLSFDPAANQPNAEAVAGLVSGQNIWQVESPEPASASLDMLSILMQRRLKIIGERQVTGHELPDVQERNDARTHFYEFARN